MTLLSEIYVQFLRVHIHMYVALANECIVLKESGIIFQCAGYKQFHNYITFIIFKLLEVKHK